LTFDVEPGTKLALPGALALQTFLGLFLRFAIRVACSSNFRPSGLRATFAAWARSFRPSSLRAK
jgi:hypothetical protein